MFMLYQYFEITDEPTGLIVGRRTVPFWDDFWYDYLVSSRTVPDTYTFFNCFFP